VLSALRRSLRNEPYEVLTAQSAAEALGWLGEVPVDAVISDERMPGMPGTELLREIRKRSPQTWLAMLTGYPGASLARACLEAGAETVLTKPWDDAALKDLLRRLLGMSPFTPKGARSEPAPG
jgi:CheY-like chemotaxis protein